MDVTAADADFLELFDDLDSIGCDETSWLAGVGLESAGGPGRIDTDAAQFFLPISTDGGVVIKTEEGLCGQDLRGNLWPCAEGMAFAAPTKPTFNSSSSSSSSKLVSPTKTSIAPPMIHKKMDDDLSLMTTAGQRLVRNGLTEFSPWIGCFDGGSDDENEEDEGDEEGNTVGRKRRRVKNKPPNPDAELIAAATEENFKLLNIDPESKEGKRQRRRIRNRLSAQFHRERKKNYITHLEGLVKERDIKLQEAAGFIDQLIAENTELRSVGEGAPASCHGSIANYSSAGSTTTASLSDDAADDGSVNLTTPPSSPAPSLSPDFTGTARTAIAAKATRSTTSVMRSGVSMLSVFFMLGITLFGPPGSKDTAPRGTPSHPAADSPTSAMSFFDTPLPLLLPTPRGPQERLESSPPTPHGRVLLSGREPTKMVSAERGAAGLVPSPVYAPTAVGLTQSMWKYQTQVADLYPPVAHFQSPFSGGTYEHEGALGNSSEPQRIRRHLRARGDQPASINGTRAAAPKASGPPPGVSAGGGRRPTQEGVDPAATAVADDLRLEVGRSLVPTALLPMQSTSSSSTSSSSTAISEAAAPFVSRIVLTQGRALLDPAMVMNSMQPPAPDHHHASTVVSTWFGTGGAPDRAAGAAAGAPKPPVVTVTGSAGAGAGNMLMMLLPASAVRWGKIWGESSEATMEAMLNGMNFGAYNSTTMGGDASAENEGMWVEIGCSIFKAQLVRNVTLSST